jgi:UDP-N-acetylmuramyl pentapeptide phosphotransferase/UDP-N-acetylglucosamine-1-phosphate transferase
MKPYTIVGILLIIIAVAAFGYQGISYTTRENVVDLGPLQVTAEKTRTLPLTPIVGGIALIGGIALLVVGQKKN